MIFEVSPEQIERLDQIQLVLLLRKLVFSELNKHHIPLRAGTVPVQINIPDGGDDGRVEWSGGPAETDWLPGRFVIFQSKKSDPGPKGLKTETWKKSTKTTEQPPELSEAMSEVLQRSGAYVVVTTSPVVGTKVDRRVKAIREGIAEAGCDPSQIATLDIYDCNKLANWTNTHPSVALWLNELLGDVHLHGFQSYDKWGREGSIANIPFQEGKAPRFAFKGKAVMGWRNDNPAVFQPQSLEGIKQLIHEFLQEKGDFIQVVAPSGYGKTRFIHQLISGEDSASSAIYEASQVIYCIYEEVKDRLVHLARDLADSGSRSLLIVDDCPETIPAQLSNIISREGSSCKLITIGVETKGQGISNSIIVSLAPADDDHIEKIAYAANNELGQHNSSYIRELSQGFPRMAVLAAEALELQDEELSSVETLADRILWGSNQADSEALEALQMFSLFTLVGMENDADEELKLLAVCCNKAYQDFYTSLHRFVGRGVVLRKGDYGNVQPVPLARYLADQWIESRPSGTLRSLYDSLSDQLKLRLLERLSWLSGSKKVQNFAVELLQGSFQNYELLNSTSGSRLFDSVMHLAPDAAMAHLENMLGDKSIDELLEFKDGRRHLVGALARLAFRAETFAPAARLLLRLAASGTEGWSNSTDKFLGLYQLYLSGTEANPAEKLTILDEGLASSDQRVRKFCVQALGRMLTTNHFSRFGSIERLGAAAPLEDWQPSTYGETYDFYRAALTRLEAIVLTDGDPLAEAALKHIDDHLTGLLFYISLFDELKEMIARLQSRHPEWHKPIKAVSSMLYHSIAWGVPEEYRLQLRSYYDVLLPTQPLDLLMLYSSGGVLDLHDPDVQYRQSEPSDHEFINRQIENIITNSPKSAEYFFPLLDEFFSARFNMASSVMAGIAQHIDDPKALLDELISRIPSGADASVSKQSVRGLLVGARQRDIDVGLQCLQTALAVEDLKPYAVDLISAVGLNNDLMRLAIDYVKTDVVDPVQTTSIAWDDFLSKADVPLVEELLQTLLDKGADGAWVLIRFLSRWLDSSELRETWKADIIVQAITNSALFEEEPSCITDTDWYDWEQLSVKLMNHGFLSEDTCKRLLGFVISSLEIESFSVQLSFNNYGQKTLRRLIDSYPKLVWERYLEKKEALKGGSIFRLESLFDADSINSSGVGVLDAVPKEIILPWMLEDKPKRIKFVLSWIRLFEGRGENRSWAPSFIDFVDSYIDAHDQLEPIISRLTSGAFIGNFSSKLEGEREQLRQLGNGSQNSYVKQWVDKMLLRMNRDIDEQRRRDSNFEAVNRL